MLCRNSLQTISNANSIPEGVILKGMQYYHWHCPAVMNIILVDVKVEAVRCSLIGKQSAS
jgi:hypothetical protein